MRRTRSQGQRPRSATAFKASFSGHGRVVAWRVLDRNGRAVGHGTAPTLAAARAEANQRIAELNQAAKTAKE